MDLLLIRLCPQVIPNLLPLFESPKLDGELRQMIRENFREFCSGLEPMDDKINTAYLMDEKIGITGGPFMMHNNNNIGNINWGV